MLTESTAKRELLVRREWLMRGGNEWYRASRPNLCYPVLIDPKDHRIREIGDPLPFHNKEKADQVEEDSRPVSINGYPVAWPVRKDGKLGIWRVEAARLRELADRGYAWVSSHDKQRGTWTLRYFLAGTIKAIEEGKIEVVGQGLAGEALLRRKVERRTVAKTMWHRGRHSAGGEGGTQLLAALLGQRGAFPFPKSVYAVKDCLAVAVGDKPSALIVDFFAGSGTTLHASMLLNADDGGSRRCILMTNNEVDEVTTARLHEQEIFRGSPEFENYGIFERATRPRCEAAITGMNPDGVPAEGQYLDERDYAEGFPENAAFYRLDYLDPDEVDLGHQFDAILPALWLAAGGIGAPEFGASARDFSIPAGSTYAVLFRESRLRAFLAALGERPDVTHVWLVTDSEAAFAEMRSGFPAGLHVSMLYRDYLRNFQINTARPQ